MSRPAPESGSFWRLPSSFSSSSTCSEARLAASLSGCILAAAFISSIWRRRSASVGPASMPLTWSSCMLEMSSSSQR